MARSKIDVGLQSRPSRLNLARLPTPVVPLDRLSKAWGGPRLWVKRDDLTGVELSGNKIRKLQYAVQEALDGECDTLVTCGGLQSNHCRATAALGAQLGLRVVLMLRGQSPQHLEGNYLLDCLFGAQIRLVTPEQYAQRSQALANIANELTENGRRPYVIDEGCSTPIGCWGYAEAVQEIAQAEQDLGVSFDAIAHPVGSGGTTAGLELGIRLHDLRRRVVAIAVSDDAAHFRRIVHGLLAEVSGRWGLDLQIDPDELEIIDDHVGDGYGQVRPEELRTLVEVARTEGLVLEPVYTGKAFHGLRHEVTRGRLRDAENVLFVHTGGIFGLAPYADRLRLD